MVMAEMAAFDSVKELAEMADDLATFVQQAAVEGTAVHKVEIGLWGSALECSEWRALYHHALREADRLGLEISLNIQSGSSRSSSRKRPEFCPARAVAEVP